MTDIAHLYRLTSPSGKIYIGIAKNVRKRWQEHAYSALVGSKCALHAAIRKYGFSEFKKEVLVTSTFSYVKQLEIKTIAAFNSLAPAGYNLTAGGDGTHGYAHTDETKRRVSAAQKGRAFSEEHRRRLSEARKGKKMSDEQKQKIRTSVKAVVRTAEWCENISKAKRGVSPKRSEENLNAA